MQVNLHSFKHILFHKTGWLVTTWLLLVMRIGKTMLV